MLEKLLSILDYLPCDFNNFKIVQTVKYTKYKYNEIKIIITPFNIKFKKNKEIKLIVCKYAVITPDENLTGNFKHLSGNLKNRFEVSVNFSKNQVDILLFSIKLKNDKLEYGVHISSLGFIYYGQPDSYNRMTY